MAADDDGRKALHRSMIPLRAEDGEARRTETSAMQPYAMYSPYQALGLAHDRMSDLQAQAAADRLASRRSILPRGFAEAAASVRRALVEAAHEEVVTVPRLADFPYRS